MSRIGKQIIAVPSGVTLRQQGTKLTIEGPKGKLEYELQPEVGVETESGVARIVRRDETRRGRSVHGLTRKLVANMVKGVSGGFSRGLEITGVGYRAEVRKDGIFFNLGYSHPILYQLPPGVTAKVDKQTSITLEA